MRGHRSSVAVLAAWAATRAPLALLILGVLPYRWLELIDGDVALYERWSQVLEAGHFPADDWYWQYPPGAALVLLAPPPLPGGYLVGFVILAALADLVVCLLVLRVAGRTGSWAGPWAWVAAMPLLGPLVYGRFDVLVTAVAVAALVAATRPAPAGEQASWPPGGLAGWLAGGLAGAGAMLKAWPILVLTGLRPGRSLWTAGTAAVATGAALLAGLAWAFPGALSFLRYQGGRGLQIESVPATVFLILRHLGWDGAVAQRYGSTELVGPGVQAVADVAPLLTLAAFGWLLLWRLRRGREADWGPAVVFDAALTATLLAVVTSRVLSPQYLVWVLALGSLCLARPDSGQRRVAWSLLVCAAVTQVGFPALWLDLSGAQLRADLVLVSRNVLLIGVTLASARALWRTTRPGRPAGTGDATPVPAGTRGIGTTERPTRDPAGSTAVSGPKGRL
jgi:hypothetical protein